MKLQLALHLQQPTAGWATERERMSIKGKVRGLIWVPQRAPSGTSSPSRLHTNYRTSTHGDRKSYSDLTTLT